MTIGTVELASLVLLAPGMRILRFVILTAVPGPSLSWPPSTSRHFFERFNIFRKINSNFRFLEKLRNLYFLKKKHSVKGATEESGTDTRRLPSIDMPQDQQLR